jgi:hypothetical protein
MMQYIDPQYVMPDSQIDPFWPQDISWLIESAGTLPIKRQNDYVEGSIDNVDNSCVMEKLTEVSVLVSAD